MKWALNAFFPSSMKENPIVVVMMMMVSGAAPKRMTWALTSPDIGECVQMSVPLVNREGHTIFTNFTDNTFSMPTTKTVILSCPVLTHISINKV